MIADPIADAERHCAELDAVNEALIKLERGLAQDFLSACRKRDVNESILCPQAAWAPGVIWRYQRLHKAIAEALNYNAPSMSEVMQLLLDVAYSEGLAEKHQIHARALIERMAASFARSVFSTQGQKTQTGD